MSDDTFTVREEDLATSIKVNFILGGKVTDSTFQATIGDRQVWATIYDDADAALAASETLLKANDQHICKFISLNLTGVNILFIEQGYGSFATWLNCISPIWEYNNDMTEVISMGFAFVNVFNGILDGLLDLFNNRSYHGNLLKGVTVSPQYEVKLFNMRYKGDDIDKYIGEDLDDFVKLVNLVIAAHKPMNNLPMPESVDLFRGLDEILKNIKLDESIKESISGFRAYFTCHNPLFADRDRRFMLTNKFVNLWIISDEVEESVVLRDSPTSIGAWWKKINPLDTYLYSRFNYASESFCKKDGVAGKKSILGFYKDCFFHTHESSKKRDTEVVAIEMDLHQTFPDFLPKCYYEFVQKCAGKKFEKSKKSKKSKKPSLSYIEYFKLVEPRII